MTDETKQPVVDAADTQAKPGSEAGSARQDDGKDLDQWLAEFDSTTKTEPAKPAPAAADTTQTDNKAILERLQAYEPVVQQFAQQQFRQQISETIKDVRGDLDPEVFDDELVEGWLNARAMKDARLQEAWRLKDANPKAWNGIKSQLGREFRKKFDKMPDRAATEDREAVTAAVRGASTKAPPDQPLNMGNMSNADARKLVREQFGFDPGY